MPIMGLNFDKILVEKKKPLKPPVNVKSDLKVTEVTEADMDAPKGLMILRFNFAFQVDYIPDFAVIELNGHVLYSEEKKKASEILKSWKKNKKVLDRDLIGNVMNAALLRSNIKALLLSQEVGLPPHIQMPLLKPKSKTIPSAYTG